MGGEPLRFLCISRLKSIKVLFLAFIYRKNRKEGFFPLFLLPSLLTYADMPICILFILPSLGELMRLSPELWNQPAPRLMAQGADLLPKLLLPGEWQKVLWGYFSIKWEQDKPQKKNQQNLLLGIAKDTFLCSFESTEVALGASFRQKCRWLLKTQFYLWGKGSEASLV